MTSVKRYTNRGITFEVYGEEEVKEAFKRIGKMPKKYLTKAAKLGMAKPLADARRAAPKGETGMLKKGIKATLETPNKRNKAVYRLNWNKKYSSHFIKPIKNPGIYGGKEDQAYYPQSVEWGFPTKYGRTQGLYFVRDAIEKNQRGSLQKVIDSLWDSIKELEK